MPEELDIYEMKENLIVLWSVLSSSESSKWPLVKPLFCVNKLPERPFSSNSLNWD